MKQRQAKWWHEGIYFGVVMYLFTTLLLPFFIESTITAKSALMGIPVWIAVGLGYSWLIRIIRKKQKATTGIQLKSNSTD